jgi:predicted ferric reductase
MTTTTRPVPPPATVGRRAPAWRTSRLARVPQVTREAALGAAVVVGGALVVAMWLQDTPAGALRSFGDELTAIGRLTGLVGAYLLLVEVALLARTPALDRTIGMDRLGVWHRRNGEYAIGLLLAHAIAITVGYALTDHHSLGRETGDVVLHYPDVLAATVALAAFVGIGVLSARAIRTRIAYHTWYFVHLYTYLAVLLSFPHQLATGDDFATHLWHRAFWVAMHLSTIALVLTFRVGAPLAAAWRHRLRVASVTREGPGVVSLTFTGQRMAELGAEPGQFFLWRFLTRGGWWQAHPFSLSAAPNGRDLRITVQDAGDHTRELARLRPGTPVIAEGPYGAMTPRRRTRHKVLLVAGGIGVTPLRALFEALPARPGELTFVYRARSDADVLFRDELDALARARGARLVYLVGGRHDLRDPLSPERLKRVVPGLASHDAYVCGSPSFVHWAASSLRRAGVPRRHIHTERFEL